MQSRELPLMLHYLLAIQHSPQGLGWLQQFHSGPAIIVCYCARCACDFLFISCNYGFWLLPQLDTCHLAHESIVRANTDWLSHLSNTPFTWLYMHVRAWVNRRDIATQPCSYTTPSALQGGVSIPERLLEEQSSLARRTFNNVSTSPLEPCA